MLLTSPQLTDYASQSPDTWPQSIFIQKERGYIVFDHYDNLYCGDYEDAIATAKVAGYKQHPTCDESWIKS